MEKLKNEIEDYAKEIGIDMKLETNKDEINELYCDLYLNNKKINFDFHYLFSKEGEYTFIIIFTIILKDIRSMFYNCSRLTSLNLSNFNTNNVNNMSYMFSFCSSLTSLNTKDERLLKEWKN